MNRSFDRKTLFLLFLTLFTLSLRAQAPDRKVTRCASVSRSAAVQNIFVDAENRKWVASGTGVFQVMGTDLSNPIGLNPGEQSAFGFRGGNADVRWTPEILEMTLGLKPEISSAWYDERNDWLWIGTTESGLFQLKTKPALKLVEKYTSGNSKLKSNAITVIFQDRNGRYWIGTDNGMLSGTPGKWKPELDGYTVQRVREAGADVYVLADGEFWAVRGGTKWETINIREKALEGEATDFDLTPNGNLWILSHMVTRYDLETDEFDVFSGAELYTSEYGNCLAADLDGAVWVGTTDKGMYLIDKASSLIVNCLIDKEPGCSGNGRDAGLKVRIEGGKAPFTYAWSEPTLQGDNPQNLAAGTYTVTVTDSNGKTKAAKIKIEDPRITMTAQQKQSESGPGKKDGAAEATVKGGAPEFRYKWDNGETTNPAKKLGEGLHSLTVTDQKGCTATASVAISQKLMALSASIEESTPIPCSGGNTMLKTTVSGGKEPYQYEWNLPRLEGAQPAGVTAGTYTLTVVDAAGGKTVTTFTLAQPASISLVAAVQASASTGNSDGKAQASPRGGTGTYSYRWDNGETAATAVGLKPGLHTVTVTDQNGCSASASVTISENILPLSASIEETGKITCHGAPSALKVNVSGGKSPFEFQWSAAGLSGFQPAEVPAGTYTVTVSDAAGGKTTVVATIKQPDLITPSAVVQAPASTGNADGKALAKAKGGTGSYQFRWDNGETAETATKLAAGAHSFTVSDDFGCSATGTVSITENILPLSASIEETSKIKCAGGQTSLRATVSGGKGPFQFQWSNPALQGEQPNGATAGANTVTVTDASGGKTTATIQVKQPEPLSASAAVKAAASTGNADGKANAQAKGGTAPYLYRWDTEETAETATRLGPGPHQVTVTDANGCSATASVSITENILPLSASIEEIGKINCFGGQSNLRATVNGGKGPFQYQWSNPALQGEQPTGVAAGEYTLVVTDAAGGKTSTAFKVREPEPVTATVAAKAPASTGGQDGKASAQGKGGTAPYQYLWDNAETTAEASRLGPGNHNVTITDANGCSTMARVSITENILPLGLSIAETAKIKCQGGTSALQVQVNGGKGPFRYQWNNPALQGEQPANVAAGAYQLSVTDAAGTQMTASFTVKEPEALLPKASVTASATAGNADGKALAEAKGGSGKYSFAWDNGETTATAIKLGPGKHAVTVSDENGCTAIATLEITENVLPLEISVDETGDILCAGGTSGLKVTVKGGKPPFQYKWDNPAWSGAEVNNLPAATYAVLVTDAKGSTQTAVAIVNQPDPLEAEIARVVGATTERSEDGKATLQVKGGTAPLTIAWNNGETTATAAKLNLGMHQVTVTDAKGCSLTKPVEIKQRILPELNAAILKSGQTIKMEQLRFEADSASLTTDALPTLDELYDFMMENGDIVIEIGGHTNSTPPDEFCDRLSTARAKSAAEYLIAKGVAAKRVVYKGYGKRQPITSNATAEGRKKNQRVEIKILALKRQ
ncbi:MAG: OmpA family protein [Saprospiraceae bacterium]|nr:OmpA family protein [Saprospiraceae bacterium]